MNNNYNVLVTARFQKPLLEEIDHAIASIRYCGWGVDRHLLEEDQLIRELKEVDIFISEYETISRKVIEASRRLKLIACCRNEPLASIDLNTATERGIPVLYPPGRNAVSVAEYAFGLMISISRHIHEVYHLIKYTKELTRVSYQSKTKGRMNVPSEWSFAPEAPMNRFAGPELAGKVLGIVGIGAIGSQAAIRANAFRMKVIAHDPYVDDERFGRFGVEKTPLDDLMRRSDYILVAARVREDNKGLISRDLLRSMKPDAYFINIARAHLVDYDALFQVLKERFIAGAAVDVYPSEPIPEDYPFIGLDNIILSPHLAGSSPDIVKYHSRMIIDDISLLIRNKRPLNLYNPISWEHSHFYQK
jgi:D-3-phosphoglycerate dehydrogenase